MANTLKLKNSVTTASAPTALEQGEVAINIPDKKVWVGDATKSPVLLVSPLTRTYYQGTIAGTTLTKVSGTAVVARVSTGVFDITAAATDALIVNLPDDHVWGETTGGAAGTRRITVRNSSVLGRTPADPATILVSIIK